MRPRVPMLVLAASVTLFVASLTQFAFYVDTPGAWNDRAYFLLLIGWFGVLGGEFSWLANPFLAASWFAASIGNRGMALASSICALVFAVSFMRRDTLLASEAPSYTRITGLGPGYWLWLASIGLALLSASLTSQKIKPPSQPPELPAPGGDGSS
jgi:hypothetical protein